MISNELILERKSTGMHLVRPQHAARGHAASVQALLRLPVNVYFMDSDSYMQRINDLTAETCGYISAANAVGKSIRDVSKQETISKILANNREVIECSTSKIDTESYLRSDDREMTALSMKFPLVEGNTVTGILGISILLEQSLQMADVLNFLIQNDLLTSDQPATFPYLKIDCAYFSHRDRDIMYFLVRGKTAKQIARLLGLSYRTIEHRLDSIKQKLNVTTKSDLIERIVDEFISLPSIDGT
jgi:DNA-binding CsgD family transcriptional regulator